MLLIQVISSLKKALQVSATDITLTFNTPDGVEVLHAPVRLPPLFDNQKTVIYALLKGQCRKKAKCSKKGECWGECFKGGCTNFKGEYTAVLKGNLQGNDIEHGIKFKIEDERAPPQSVPVIHSLLAKSLIQDWQYGYGLDKLTDDSKERKSAIIKLSVESSVVSSHTAYVAVDEDQDKPIEGAMKVWDIVANYARPWALWGSHRGMGTSPIHRHISHKAYRKLAPAGIPRARKSKAAAKKSVPKKAAAKRKRKVASVPVANKRRSTACSRGSLKRRKVERDSSSDSDEDMEATETEASTATMSGDVVMLQTAEGYWMLNASLAVIIGHSLADLESSCPLGCSTAVWGTVLALVLLEKRYLQQKDEWELIATKAEMWLQGQSLPSGVTVASLKDKAQQYF